MLRLTVVVLNGKAAFFVMDFINIAQFHENAYENFQYV